MKTTELTGAALDWAVAKAMGLIHSNRWTQLHILDPEGYSPSTDWSQGGPIIEREKIETKYIGNTFGWRAFLKFNTDPMLCYSGLTPLIAAMRCYVASKLGEEIEIPKELR